MNFRDHCELEQKISLSTRSVHKVSSHATQKKRHLLKKIQDTKNTVYISVPFKVGTLGAHTVLPITISCPVVFSWISSTVWNLFPFKGDFSFGVKSHRAPNLGCRGWGVSHLGNLMFHQKTTPDVMHEWAHCCGEAANHQFPIAAAFWFIPIVSQEKCSSLTQNLIQIHCSPCSVILSMTATQYTCSLNGMYCPYWLVQWSRHHSHMHIPVHSPWLPDYIEVALTILVILTMVGLFLDRPHILQMLLSSLSPHFCFHISAIRKSM